jgi:hypothetical protein
MDEIWAALKDVIYPASRQQLIDAAIATDAPHDLVHRLEALPEERYVNADELARDLVHTRATSNPALVAIQAEPCPQCGFMMVPGKPHSCIEEKARFAESANKVTDEFEILDEGREAEK